MQKKILGGAILLGVLLAGGIFLRKNIMPKPANPPPIISDPALKEKLFNQLNEEPENTPRQLAIPIPPKGSSLPFTPIESVKGRLDPSPRAEGRKKREGLPMGVVLWDRVEVKDAPGGKTNLYLMNTGDMVRVFLDEQRDFWHIQPGLDVYLAATTKEIRPAGEHLPDKDGWVKKSDLHLFEPTDAKEFILEVSPVTLGNDPSFSSFSFYERAMKNPDPVVHRVAGPRLIALVLLHEDYSTSWSTLLRDHDPKIRDSALAALRARGVANSRTLIDDLIVRLNELTQTKATSERELEVLSLLGILKDSHHPRVPIALASFKEAWKQTQGEKINAALNDIFVTSGP